MSFKMITNVRSFCLVAVMSLVLCGGVVAHVCHAEEPSALPAGTAGAASAPASSGGLFSGGGAQQPGGIMAFAPFVLMFGVLYFLILRPQQKKIKEQTAMLGALKHGDEIVTASGLLGKITGITEKVVTLEVADSVRIKMLKSQVAQVIKGSINDLAT